jgi:hypothetical protein
VGVQTIILSYDLINQSGRTGSIPPRMAAWHFRRIGLPASGNARLVQIMTNGLPSDASKVAAIGKRESNSASYSGRFQIFTL